MAWILKEKWLWITIFSLILILVGSWFLLWFLLLLPDIPRIIMFFSILFAWGIVAGYKDWIKSKRKS
ncbi:MAG: hypothetical protein ACTSV7_03585 [Candidatus Baldrarchaeia archaeon]